MKDEIQPARPLCHLSEVGALGKEIRIEGDTGPQWLMLFRRNGTLTAWRNVCPHQGRALNWAPDKFLFSDDGLLVCSHHGASFELQDGHCIDGPCKGARLTAVAIRIEDDQILIDDS